MVIPLDEAYARKTVVVDLLMSHQHCLVTLTLFCDPTTPYACSLPTPDREDIEICRLQLSSEV